MRQLNVFARFQIADGARNLQNPVVRAGGKSLPKHCAFEQIFAFRVQSANAHQNYLPSGNRQTSSDTKTYHPDKKFLVQLSELLNSKSKFLFTG